MSVSRVGASGTVRPFAANQERKPRGGLIPSPVKVFLRAGERFAKATSIILGKVTTVRTCQIGTSLKRRQHPIDGYTFAVCGIALRGNTKVGKKFQH